MRTSMPYAIIGLGVIIMAFIAWWFGFRESPVETPALETPAPLVTEGISIYTNGEHGFLLTYPNGARVEEEFTTANLSQTWRMNALPDASGTPLVSITTYETESENSYPRFYRALVRVGSSSDQREVAACEEPRTEQAEVELEDRVINGIPFKAFQFEGAGMMKYVTGVSYRAVRNETCYAIEAIRSGSTYREDAPSARDIPDEVLDRQFDALDSIVASFQFAR